MALKKLQFLFIKVHRLIIARVFFPFLIFQRDFYLQIPAYERILQPPSSQYILTLSAMRFLRCSPFYI